jgi:DNA repair protein RadC
MKKEKIATDHRKGHRKRLREKFLERKCTDKELMELLLTYALPRVDVKPIVHALLKKYGNIYRVITMPYEELLRIPGIGKVSAVFLKALYDLMLVDYKYYLSEQPMFVCQKRLEDYCRLALLGKRQEEFHVLYLDFGRRLMTDDTHAVGTMNCVGVYPREILRCALDLNARYVILLHNHPDGNGSFSQDDIELTMKIKEKLDVDGIEIIDHFLLVDDVLYSARNLHWLK